MRPCTARRERNSNLHESKPAVILGFTGDLGLKRPTRPRRVVSEGRRRTYVRSTDDARRRPRSSTATSSSSPAGSATPATTTLPTASRRTGAAGEAPRAHDRRPRGHPQRVCRLPGPAGRAASGAAAGARVAGAAGDLGLVEGRALVLRVIGIGQARPCLPEAPTRLLGGNGPGATSSIDRGLPTERLLAPHRHQASRSGSLGPTNRRGRPSRASAQSRSWRQRPARSGCRVQRRL